VDNFIAAGIMLPISEESCLFPIFPTLYRLMRLYTIKEDVVERL